MLSNAKFKLHEAWTCKLKKKIISVSGKSFLLCFVLFYSSRIFSGNLGFQELAQWFLLI